MILQITGAPGSGKSFSLRNLNPSETVVIDTDMKGLGWSGWRTSYNKTLKNYITENDIDKIKSYILGIVKSMPHVKTIVIDTLSTIMTDKLHSDRKKAGFDKYKSLGDDAYELYSFVRTQIPDEIIVVFMCHSEKYKYIDESFQEQTYERTLFPGAMTTKMNLAKFLNYNLYTVYDSAEEDISKRFKLSTISNGRNEARSVYGVLPHVMPNDLAEVIRLIKEKDLMIEPAATKPTA